MDEESDDRRETPANHAGTTGGDVGGQETATHRQPDQHGERQQLVWDEGGALRVEGQDPEDEHRVGERPGGEHQEDGLESAGFHVRALSDRQGCGLMR